MTDRDLHLQQIIEEIDVVIDDIIFLLKIKTPNILKVFKTTVDCTNYYKHKGQLNTSFNDDIMVAITELFNIEQNKCIVDFNDTMYVKKRKIKYIKFKLELKYKSHLCMKGFSQLFYDLIVKLRAIEKELSNGSIDIETVEAHFESIKENYKYIIFNNKAQEVLNDKSI